MSAYALTVQKIIPLKIDDDADLRRTIESFRLIQQQISDIAFNNNCVSSAIKLHELSYDVVKGRVKSQLTCTAIRMVASAYALAKRKRRRLSSPIQFSVPRALFLIGRAKRDATKPSNGTIKVWTVGGRKTIPCIVPAQFKAEFEAASSYDSLAVGIKRGRLVATISVSIKPPGTVGNKPIGIALSSVNDVAVVAADGRSLRIVATAQRVMEEVTQKTKNRLTTKLTEKKADGRSTRSVRRTIKRLSRKLHLRNRSFSHTVAKLILGWAGDSAALVIEDLRRRPPSRRKGGLRPRPGYYEVVRRRIEEKAERAGIAVFYASVDSNMRCSECGAQGIIKRGYLHCVCGGTHVVSKNTAINVRNKFTVARPWADANQPRSSTPGKNSD